MTDLNYTALAMVSDRSGSMVSCKDDAQGGIRAFIDEHKKAPGKCDLYFVQFDTEHDVVHDGPIADAPRYILKPRGGTALLDAIGFAVTTLGERLSAMPEEQRPGTVILVISTDGQENSSREYTSDQIKQMLTTQQDTYSWQVIFLGANIDAVNTAATYGIPQASALQFNTSNSSGTYAMAASNSVLYRGNMSRGMGHAQSVAASAFTDDQRQAAMSGGAVLLDEDEDDQS